MWPKERCNRATVNFISTKSEDLVDEDGSFHYINIAPTDVRLHLVSSASMDSGKTDYSERRLTMD